MGYWTNVVVEGFCFGEADDNGNNPCGRNIPSPFCLMNDVCPHFAWSNATERDASRFVPMKYILKDRMLTWGNKIGEKLSWWFWDSLWFNRRKVDKFFDDIKVVTAENSPFVAKMEEEDRKHQIKFEKWFPKAKKGW